MPESGLRILVSAGPTREYFDTVRFISNPSTGTQGFEIARAAAARGHTVTLVSGPVQHEDPPQVEVIRVTTAAEMAATCKAAFDTCDAAIMTAAVCDYRPVQRLTQKLEKGDASRTCELQPTEDICASLGRMKGRRILVGFAMDDHDGMARAELKLARKQCDVIVQNGPENIGADNVTVRILTKNHGWQDPVSNSKSQVAISIVRLVEQLAAQNQPAMPDREP